MREERGKDGVHDRACSAGWLIDAALQVAVCSQPLHTSKAMSYAFSRAVPVHVSEVAEHEVGIHSSAGL